MVKKTIKFTDFNGNECEETLYFNLTKSELTKMEVGIKGGMSNYIKEVVESEDGVKILDLFTDLLVKSYGVKSEDGKRFVKNEILAEEFRQSAAFDELFMEMATNPQEAEAFMKGITNQ